MTLRLVARYGDACNIGGTAESVAEKDAILRRHCEELGRDEREIERTVGMGAPIIRDSRAEAERVQAQIFEHNGGAKTLGATSPSARPRTWSSSSRRTSTSATAT